MASDGLEKASKLNFITNDHSDQLQVNKFELIPGIDDTPSAQESFRDDR